jgi:hypothetical protein
MTIVLHIVLHRVAHCTAATAVHNSIPPPAFLLGNCSVNCSRKVCRDCVSLSDCLFTHAALDVRCGR